MSLHLGPDIAVLRCVGRLTNGSRCTADAVPGTRRCRLHRTITPERMRCHHYFPDGTRCERQIEQTNRDRADYWVAHPRPCPGIDGNCERHITTLVAPLCNWCAAEQRRRDRRCALEVAEAETCDTLAAKPGQRCGRHSDLPTDEHRCRWIYTSGAQCHRRRSNREDTCVTHRNPCEVCDEPTGYLPPARCRKHRIRCAHGTCNARVRAEGERCERCAGQLATCSVWSPAKDRRCTRPVKANGRCGWHQQLPPDTERCAVIYPDGQRCIAPKLAGNPDAACRYHCHRPRMLGRERRANVVETQAPARGRARETPCHGCVTPTTATSGWCATCSTTRGRRCAGTALTTGRRCSRPPTVDGLCATHDRMKLADGDDRCVEQIDDEQGGALRCSLAPVEGATRCKAHGGRKPRRMCPHPTTSHRDGSQGVCGGAPMGNGACPRHQTVLALADDERCVHRWADGRRCCLSATSQFVANSSQTVCPFHRVACEYPGCPSKTADLERLRCPKHRDICTELVAAGHRCLKPAVVGSGRCEVHLVELADEERCRFIHDNGQRCHASRFDGKNHRSQVEVWRDFCLGHGHPGGAPHCDAITRFADRRCRYHRPQCAGLAIDGRRCRYWSFSPEGLCPRHHAIAYDRTCALRTVLGEPCRTPALLDHGDDGRICERHANSLAGMDEALRCRHRYLSGERCAAVRQLLTRVDGRQVLRDGCSSHLRGLPPCEVVTAVGQPCGKEAMEGHEPDHPRCNLHPVIPDDERCAVEVSDGVRCFLARSAYYDACSHHMSLLPRCEQTVRSTGGRCSWAVSAGESVCRIHLPPEDDAHRCTVIEDDHRCRWRKWGRWGVCLEHRDQAPRCGARIRATGELCDSPAHEDREGCGRHLPPEDDAHRCTVIEDDHRCRWRTTELSRVCSEHAHLQPRCEAIVRGFACRRFAVEPHPTCDHHHGFTPGSLDHDEEALMRFFIRPRADKLMALQEASARALLSELTGSYPQQLPHGQTVSHPARIVTARSNAVGGEPVPETTDELPDAVAQIAASDPYDLTGARRRYRDMVAGGADPAKAARAVELMARGRATTTLKSYTSKLKPWFEWCEQAMVKPCPADPTDVLVFLGWLAERGRTYDGQPLQASTFTSFQNALSRLHEATKNPNPFELDPDLRMALHGYTRTYGRIQRQAHAVRAPELVRLVQAAQGTRVVSEQTLRDEAILAIVADPEVGISLREAAAVTWADVLRWPSEGTDEPVVLVAGRGKKTEREVEIPNRSATISSADLASGEVPLVMRLCGVATLRSLYARKVSSGGTPTGPIFPKDGAAAMSNNGIKKVITSACNAAGVEYALALSFDDRSALLTAIDEPDFIGLRDAAILCVCLGGRRCVAPRSRRSRSIPSEPTHVGAA